MGLGAHDPHAVDRIGSLGDRGWRGRPHGGAHARSGGEPANRVDGNVVANSYLGARCLVVVEIGNQRIRVEAAVRPTGNKVSMRFPKQALRVFPRRAPDELEAV